MWVLYGQVSGPLTGWIASLAGQNHWLRETFWPVQLAIFFPFGFIGGVISGWLVARFHRPQLAAALLALVTTWVALDLRNLMRLAPDAWGYPNYRYQLAMNLASLLCMIFGTFVRPVDPDSQKPDDVGYARDIASPRSASIGRTRVWRAGEVRQARWSLPIDGTVCLSLKERGHELVESAPCGPVVIATVGV